MSVSNTFQIRMVLDTGEGKIISPLTSDIPNEPGVYPFTIDTPYTQMLVGYAAVLGNNRVVYSWTEGGAKRAALNPEGEVILTIYKNGIADDV